MNRKRLFTSLSMSILFLGIALAFLMNVLTGIESINNLIKGIGTKGLIALVTVVAVLLLFLNYLKDRYEQKSNQTVGANIPENEFEENTQRFFTSLKDRYQRRYEQKLDGRFEITLEVSENFDDLEGLEVKEKSNKNPNDGNAITFVSKAFEQKGRLLIVGDPGAGKTVLLLKLASNLLEKISERLKKEQENQKGQLTGNFFRITEPFPVIFNLASWSAEYEKFDDWLVAMLNSGESLSKDFAARLLHEERIIFLLDGLDELARNEDKKTAAEKRAACLKALNQYLDRGKKAVICCRVDEYWQMKDTGQDAPVAAEVKVLDLTKAEVLLALEHAKVHKDIKHHASAENLSALLVKEEYDNLLEVLRTPFYFTTALEIFDRQILEENNFPRDEKELKKCLIDNYIERKLESTPNPKNFKSKKIRRWLKWLAQLLENKKITFELADLQPEHLKRPWVFRFLLGFVTYIFLSSAFAFHLVYMTPSRSLVAIIENIITSFIAGFIGGALLLPFCLLFGFRTKSIPTEDASQFSLEPLRTWNTWRDILFTSLFYGLFGFLIPLFLSLFQPKNFPTATETIIGAIILLILIIFIERIFDHCRVVKRFVGLKKAYQRLKNGVIYNLIRVTRLNVIIVCILFVLDFYDGGDWAAVVSFRSTLFILLPFTLVLGLLNTVILKHFILRLCLTVANVVPLRYATFLDYASELRVLERDGGHWRFRHQILQKHFNDQV